LGNSACVQRQSEWSCEALKGSAKTEPETQ
jgi:hypothetical protein